MKISEANILIEKAKVRKDGVYSYKGNLWAVKNNVFVAFINPFGEVYQRNGSFLIMLGVVKEKYERRKKLTEWLQKNK